jgi:radical SAM protein with 4Fe4S-binding SPASM domain
VAEPPSDDDLLADLHERAYASCIPLTVTLELTLRCNIRCTHCYNFDRGAPRPVPSPELSFDEVRALLDDLRRAGTLYLGLTGGEAMVHPRFWDILDEAASRHFAITLLSNGTLLSEANCDRLRDCPALQGVSLSLYGARPETHDAVTRSPGSHRRTLEGARRLRERGVEVGLKLVVLGANARETEAMLRAAEEEGFAASVDTTISGRYDGTLGSLATRVDLDTLEALYRGPLRPLLERRLACPTDDEFKCNCARANAAVSAGGDVYPCIAAPVRAGNVRERPFPDIWRHSPVFAWIRGLRLEDFKTCAPCPTKAWCRRSPGVPYLLHGDYTGVDPWTCGEAEIIRRVLEGPSPGQPLLEADRADEL